MKGIFGERTYVLRCIQSSQGFGADDATYSSTRVSRQINVQESEVFLDSQYSKTETTGNGDLFLLLHVEIPDNEPGKNRKGEVCGDKPCFKTSGLAFMYTNWGNRGNLSTHIQQCNQPWKSQANNGLA